MADRRKVHPDCPNASNPYHECIEVCYMKIANGKPHKGSKQSGNRPTLEEFHKKVPKERKVHRGCPNASNPYHECGDHCLEKIARAEQRRKAKESGSPAIDAPQNLNQKKERNMQPKATEARNNLAAVPLDSATTYTQPLKPTNALENGKVPAISAVAAPSPPSRPNSREVEEIEELEPAVKPVSSSPLHSGVIYPEDFSFNKGQVKSSPPAAISGNTTPMLGISPDNSKELKKGTSFASSTHSKEEDNNNDDNALDDAVPRAITDDLRNSMPRFLFGSMGSRSSMSSNDRFSNSDEEEVQSAASESRVSVGKYVVKASVASILEAILEKYGDIAENCQLESIAMRSYYLECICFVVQELQNNSFMHLTKPKIKEMLAIVKDMEASRVNVGWLHRILDELSEVSEFTTQHQTIKAAKTKCDRALESAKKELELQQEDLAKKEQDIANSKAKIAEIQERMRELELESTQLNDSFSSLSSQIDSFHFKTLLDELL